MDADDVWILDFADADDEPWRREHFPTPEAALGALRGWIAEQRAVRDRDRPSLDGLSWTLWPSQRPESYPPFHDRTGVEHEQRLEDAEERASRGARP